MRTPRRLGGAMLTATAAALVAACAAPGPGATTGPSTAATQAPATQAPVTDPPMSAPPATNAPAGGLTLTLATDATLGQYIAGENGMALYIFTPDGANPGKSVCNGDCAAAWPPLTVDAAGDVSAGSGITGSVSTVTRDDGTLQVAVGGWPLYYFAGDKAAGDVTGQGVQDVWYLAGPTGVGVGAPRDEDPAY